MSFKWRPVSLTWTPRLGDARTLLLCSFAIVFCVGGMDLDRAEIDHGSFFQANVVGLDEDDSLLKSNPTFAFLEPGGEFERSMRQAALSLDANHAEIVAIGEHPGGEAQPSGKQTSELPAAVRAAGDYQTSKQRDVLGGLLRRIGSHWSAPLEINATQAGLLQAQPPNTIDESLLALVAAVRDPGSMTDSPAFWAVLLVLVPAIFIIIILSALGGMSSESSSARKELRSATKDSGLGLIMKSKHWHQTKGKLSQSTLSEASTTSSSASRAVSEGVASGPLCPAMQVLAPPTAVVEADPGGTLVSTVVSIRGPGPFVSTPQNSTYNVSLQNKMGTEDIIGRILFAEGNKVKDSGVLFEHGSYSIAVVDTARCHWNAVKNQNMPDADGPDVIRILRARDSRMEPFAALSRSHGPSGEFQVLNDAPGPNRGKLKLRVNVPNVVRDRLEVTSAHFTDSEGRLIARMERAVLHAETKYTIVFGLSNNADCALVILSLIATVKLCT